MPKPTQVSRAHLRALDAWLANFRANPRGIHVLTEDAPPAERFPAPSRVASTSTPYEPARPQLHGLLAAPEAR